MSMLILSLIVAMMPNRIIGNNKGELPWGRLPSDMRRFKALTLEAGTVIMGRTTYNSIVARHHKPLEGRKNIVLTKGSIPTSVPESVYFVGSADEAREKALTFGKQACVIGGGEIYRLFLPDPNMVKAHITIVHGTDLPGDVFFPKLVSRPNTEWIPTLKIGISRSDPEDEHDTSFVVYERISII